MKIHFKALALALLAAGFFSAQLCAAPGPGGMNIPAGWVRSDQASATTGFEVYFTSFDPKESLVVMIRTIPGKAESALQWAKDEAANLQAKGITVLGAPLEITVSGQGWVKLESWPNVRGADGQARQAKSEQYFVKTPEGAVLEVSVNGPETNFNPANKASVEELLASYQGGTLPAGAQVETVASLGEGLRKADEKLQQQLLTEAAGLGLPEEQRKLFYQEYLATSREITEEARAKYPGELSDQARYRTELSQKKIDPLLARYGLKLNDIASILSEARQKHWNDKKK
jgi:hypothetical protein